MKSMRALVIVLVMMLLGGIIGFGPTASKNNRQTVLDCRNDDSVEYEYVSENGDNNVYGELDTVIDEHEFPDRRSWQHLSADSTYLPGFVPYHYDATANFSEGVSYDITVDFPKRTVNHCDAITKWLIGRIESSQDHYSEVPLLNAIYIGYAKKTNTGWHYDGDIHHYKRICKFASDVYFAMVKSEYSMNETDFPGSLFSTLCLKAYMNNDRFVTYQQYTHGYDGGAHGYYTERLLSYDHVHKQEIDYKYLFNDDYVEQIIALLIGEAKKSPDYEKWNPDIEQYTCVKDENGKPTGQRRLPQPGLSDEGVIFSFQPYEISCFAAGAFHFTIPYERLRPYLTERANWCVNIE